MYSYEDYVRYKGYQFRYANEIFLYKIYFYGFLLFIVLPFLMFLWAREDKAQKNRNASIAFQECLDSAYVANICEVYDYYKGKSSKKDFKSYEQDLLEQYKTPCYVYRYDFNKDTRAYCGSIYNKTIEEIEYMYPWYFYGSYEKERK